MLNRTQISAYRTRVLVTEFEFRHVGMARRESALERARELIEIDFTAEYAKRRGVRMPAFAFHADCMAAPAEFRDQRLTVADHILRTREGAGSAH